MRGIWKWLVVWPAKIATGIVTLPALIALLLMGGVGGKDRRP